MYDRQAERRRNWVYSRDIRQTRRQTHKQIQKKGTGCTRELYDRQAERRRNWVYSRDIRQTGRQTHKQIQKKKELGVLVRCTTDRQREEETGCTQEIYVRRTDTRRNWVYSRDVRQTGHVKLLLLFLLVSVLVAPASFPAKRKPVHRNPFHVVTQWQAVTKQRRLQTILSIECLIELESLLTPNNRLINQVLGAFAFAPRSLRRKQTPRPPRKCVI